MSTCARAVSARRRPPGGSAAGRRTHRPVLFVRATLSKVADPPPRSALASVRADLNGTVLNAQTAGSIEEAVGLTADRLRVRLERTPEHSRLTRVSPGR
ncbi:hypothetical protein [Actinomadura rayongensis]|uniref:Uncharacterized protein n=1 Tax=Actinomadura rayongensis TaxID=1429076 RepID=A0A6I4W820_9ACTN|nr:hypothetical protein [Actinomadura rayongensis]MXQ64900.1 hypothetical protein [Actinomadura rayongensis]